MVRLLNTIATRLALLALLNTAITMLVGLGAYYAEMYYRLAFVVRHMPPKARAEFEFLIRTNQQGSDRYYVLLDRFGSSHPGVSDLPLIGMIALISALAGGGIAVLLSRRISRPITAVARAALRVSAGERSVRVEQRGVSGETGDLLRSFNRMAADIEAYERERTVLTAGIAHELRTPLTILKGKLHGLIDGVIDPAKGESDRLLRQVEQLSRVVEDLRTLAHADAGELGLDRRSIELKDVLQAVVDDLRQSAAGSGVAVTETYATARVRGDAVRLTQVFTNILTNAIKHAPDHSRIDVALFTAHGCAVASVIDEGAGFSPDDEARLFIPFWRAASDKHAGRPGSGIGLALATKLIEAHGGRIVAKNRVDRSGACFSIWLPLENAC